MLSYLSKKKIFLFLTLIFGIFISRIISYGDDVDSHSLIHTYLNIINNGIYSPSRFYGSPLAEFLIGFLSYFFGGKVSAFISYILFFFSLNFLFFYFYKTEKEFLSEKRIIFIILCLSNPILIFDNVNPSDYILSLFFFSSGLFLLKTNLRLFSSILFAFSIACRANFAAFIIIIFIMEFVFNKNNNFKKDNILIGINTLIISFLFYLPITIQHKFKIDYIYNSGGPKFELSQLLPRFLYKFYLLFGVYNSLLFLLIFIITITSFKIKKVKQFVIQEKILITLVITNAIIFFFIPTKTSIISIVIILIYILLIKNFNKKIISAVIFFNILYWIVSYQLLEIKYKYNGICDPILAVDAKFNFEITPGFFLIKKDKIKNKIECDSKTFINIKIREKFINGEKLLN
jgi:hypothetical protein